MHFPAAMLALAAALLLAGCGQMGPLYLPEEATPAPAATAPAAATTP
jgi:predicted small lipoprotein YifL